MIRFEEPLILLLLLLPAALWAIRRKSENGIPFSSLAILKGSARGKTTLYGLPRAAILAVFALAVVALANPLAREMTTTEEEYGYRIPIAFDLSHSMRQRGRLEHAKAGAIEFVRSRSDQDLIALIPWATTIHMEHGAFFTTDVDFLAERIAALRTMGLTAMGDAALFSAVTILSEVHYVNDLGELGVPEPSYTRYRSLIDTASEGELASLLEELAFYYQGLIEGSFILIVTDAVGEMNAGIDWDRAVAFVVALDIPMYLISVEAAMGRAIRDVLDEAGIEFFHVEDARDVSAVYRLISERNPTLLRLVREEENRSLRPEVALAAGLLAGLGLLGYSTFIVYTRREM